MILRIFTLINLSVNQLISFSLNLNGLVNIPLALQTLHVVQSQVIRIKSLEIWTDNRSSEINVITSV